MMKAKQQINLARANIVRQFSNGDIDDRTAREQMRQLEEQSIMTPQMKAMISALGGAGTKEVDGYTIKQVGD
jgi:hypothetical protein